MRRTACFILFFILLLSFYCGGSSSSSSPSGETPTPLDFSPDFSVTGIVINKTTTGLLVGGSETLRSFVFPRTATNQNVTWATSDGSIVSVSNGTITGEAAGTATITATAADNTNGTISSTCTVIVSAISIPVTNIILSYPTTRIPVQKTSSINAVIIPNTATNQAVTWGSSNTSVATIDSNGIITGEAAGTATITATAADNTNGIITNSVGITVGNYIRITGTISNWSDYTWEPGFNIKTSIYDDDTFLYDLSGENYPNPSGNFNITLDETISNIYLEEATSANFPSGFTFSPSSGVFVNLGDIYMEMFNASHNFVDGIYYSTTDNHNTFPYSEAELSYASANVTINGSVTEFDSDEGAWCKFILNNVTLPAGYFWIMSTTYKGSNNTQADPRYTTILSCESLTNLVGFKFYGGDN